MFDRRESGEKLLMALLNKKVVFTYMCLLSGFSIFFILFAFTSCVGSFHCMGVRLKEGEGLKGQVVAAKAWKYYTSYTTEVIIGTVVT